MKVLIASDGGLDADKTAETAARLCGSDGTITVLTAVEIPRSMIDGLRQAYEENRPPPVDTDAEYVSARSEPSTIAANWPGDDAFLERFVNDETDRRLGDLIQALQDRQISPTVRSIESENPAQAILTEIGAGGYDCVVIGAHGQGRFDGLIGSVGTKVVRRSPVTVVVSR